MKKGFTLSELLISLMLVAIVVAITIPVITKSISTNSLKIYSTLYKSAFKTSESIVGDLTSDLNLYPTGNFLNTTSAGYFCNNFAGKVNITGGATQSCSSSTVPNSPNFTTSNGMRWYGLNNTFSTGSATIYVDIDGQAKGTNTAGSDILQIIVYDQGRMTSPAGLETSYLSQ